jgi:DNA replication protein DnaC
METETTSPATPPQQAGPESSTKPVCVDCKKPVDGVNPDGICIHCGIERQRAEMRKLNEARENSRRWKALEEEIGAAAVKNFTLGNFKPYDETTKRALEMAYGFHPSSSNLYLFGVPGCGKTHLAVGMALNCYLDGKTVFFFPSGPALSRYFRGIEAQEEKARIKALSEADVLVINELGIGRDTEFSIAMAVEVIDARIMRGKNGLIVTSNLHPSDLAQKSKDARLESRFTGLCKIIEVGQEDYRKVHRQG